MAKAEVKRSRKIKQRSDPVAKLGRSIGVPTIQLVGGGFSVRDVVNHADADQRASIRSGETKTLQRKPKLHKLFDAKVITLAQLKACEWYAERFSAGFDTVGITANYGGAGGGGCTAYTHLARHKEQMLARQEYEAARQSIPSGLLSMFERVVLHGRPMGRLGISFRWAVGKLQDHLIEIGEVA